MEAQTTEVSEAPQTNVGESLREALERNAAAITADVQTKETSDAEFIETEGEEEITLEESNGEGEETGEEERPEVSFEPHKDFTAEERDALMKLYEADPEGAEALNSKAVNLLKGFHDKAQEAANYRKELAGFDTLFADLDGQLQAQGFTRASYVNNLIQMDREFSNDPRDFIERLAEQAEISLVIDEEDEGLKTDPTLRKLEQQVENMTKAQQTQAMSAFESQVQAWQSKTDAGGNPTHPHLEEVFEDMMAYMRGNTQASQRLNTLQFSEADFDKAYRVAMAANGKALTPAQPEKNNDPTNTDQRKRVARARAGTKAVSSTKGNVKATPPKTTREALRMNAQKMGMGAKFGV